MSIAIEIDEGTVSKIKHINIVGNEVFNDETLLELFELQLGGMFSFFSSADKYSKEKLESDLETLTSYYQDRGYLQFEIESTQVAVSPLRTLYTSRLMSLKVICSQLPMSIFQEI